MVNYRENSVAGMGYVHEESLTAELFFPEYIGAMRGTKPLYRFFKRAFDIAAAAVALLLLAVPMLAISAIIALDSKGSPVFSQNRVGRGGKTFRILKFRTMVTSAPSETPTGELERPYDYITRVGEFLRKTSLDELPQLINVLKGDMSIVGPRPLIAGETEIHRLRRINSVYDVRPGMTGWAQINGRDSLTTAEKVRYDAEYVARRSLGFDMKVMLRTVAVVLKRDGYAEGAGLPDAAEEE